MKGKIVDPLERALLILIKIKKKHRAESNLG